jgi:hypothetical protein
MWTLATALHRLDVLRCYQEIGIPYGETKIKIVLIKASPKIGLHSWGAVDYLRRFHNYRIRLISEAKK